MYGRGGGTCSFLLPVSSGAGRQQVGRAKKEPHRMEPFESYLTNASPSSQVKQRGKMLNFDMRPRVRPCLSSLAYLMLRGTRSAKKIPQPVVGHLSFEERPRSLALDGQMDRLLAAGPAEASNPLSTAGSQL